VENREFYRKTKIGTEVPNVTRDSDTTFKVNRSKVNLQHSKVAVCLFMPRCSSPHTGTPTGEWAVHRSYNCEYCIRDWRRMDRVGYWLGWNYLL